MTKLDFSEVKVCPICQSKRISFNAMRPIEFECGSYTYESKKNKFHFFHDGCFKEQ